MPPPPDRVRVTKLSGLIDPATKALLRRAFLFPARELTSRRGFVSPFDLRFGGSSDAKRTIRVWTIAGAE